MSATNPEFPQGFEDEIRAEIALAEKAKEVEIDWGLVGRSASYISGLEKALEIFQRLKKEKG